MMSPVSDALHFLSQTSSRELFISAGCRPKCWLAAQTIVTAAPAATAATVFILNCMTVKVGKAKCSSVHHALSRTSRLMMGNFCSLYLSHKSVPQGLGNV